MYTLIIRDGDDTERREYETLQRARTAYALALSSVSDAGSIELLGPGDVGGCGAWSPPVRCGRSARDG